MVDYTTEAIYLGVFTDFEIVDADNSFNLAGASIGSSADPISQSRVTEIVYSDTDNNGLIEESTGETVSYSIGGADPITQVVDNSGIINALIIYADGSSFTGNFAVSQAADGSVFLVPFSSSTSLSKKENDANLALEAAPIDSIFVLRFLKNKIKSDVDEEVPLTQINILCFTKGTKILTVWGEKPIEHLAKGDIIITRYNGPQILRWIGSTTVPAIGKFAPIMIKAGALDNRQDLLVSPQHRMLIEGWKSDVLFGEPEVLVAAKYMVNGDTIYVSNGGTVEYFHLLFDTHQIIFSHGAASESFHLGNDTANGMAIDTREEILALFPQLRDDLDNYGPSARASLKQHEAMVLVNFQIAR